MSRRSCFAVVVLLLTACSSERSSTASTSNSTTTTADTFDTTTVPATTPTTVADVTTTGPCPAEGDTDAKASDDPLFMSGMVGVDIRAGAHPCFERVVIELGGGTSDFPGWTVEYVDDPVRLGQSDEFVEIAGDATLQVTMRMWMPEPGTEGGYSGPIQFVPDNVFHVLELRETENNEGICIWSIGLDAQYPFTVEVFQDPDRLVIDIQIPG